MTRSVAPETLEIGDDITYMVDETTSITHRIVGIEKHSADTGDYAFQTQGIANSRPDEKKVYAVNVVGKVIFHSVLLGTVLSAVRENWPLVLFFIAVLWVFMKVIRYILRPEEGDEEVQEMQGEETTENKK